MSGISSFTDAQNIPQIFLVNYISAENVYLDSGTSRGLTSGDQLIIRDGRNKIAEIEVIFVSQNSASCKILKQTAPIQKGFIATISQKTQPVFSVKEKSELQEYASNQSISYSAKTQQEDHKSFAEINGSLSFQLFHFNDLGPANLDFTQPTVRFKFKANNLWGRAFQLKIRTRTRHNQRTRSYNTNVPKEEWRNRIYEFSLSYDNENAPFNFTLGRIINNFTSGIGYIDGGLIQFNALQHFRVGVFGGHQPEWQYSDFQTSFQKYGGYLNVHTGDFSSFTYEGTLGIAGVYHSSVVSREFVYIQNRFSSSSRWNIYQSAEVDINRDWRLQKSGEDMTISNFYLSMQYKLSNQARIGLSYDNRKNYWSYETMSIADSLYDTLFRRGIRGNIIFRLPAQYSFSVNFGYRNREGETESTYTYAANLNKTNFIIKGLFWGLHGAGFSSPMSDGYNFSGKFGKYFRGGNSLSITYGNYFYDFSAAKAQVNNRWLRFNTQLQFIRHTFFIIQYETGLSGDIKGNKILAEIGYRF